MTLVLGIDPGLAGAIAAIGCGNDLVLDTPTVKAKRGHAYLVASMRGLLDDLLAAHPGDGTLAVLESGIAMPRQSSATTFKTGQGIGLWEGLLAGLGVRYEFVAPGTWKRALGLPTGAGKGESVVLAQRLFPALSGRLARVKDHGRAEALLIAEWGRRRVEVAA